MSRFSLEPLARFASFFCVAALFLTGSACAQSAVSQSPSPTTASSQAPNLSSSTWSSSLAGTEEIAELSAPEASAALPSAPAPSSAAAGQYNSGGTSRWSGLAFEAGFGFNPPESNSIGNGWNLQVGAGVHAGPNFTPLIEYQYIHTGLAQYIINQVGTQGGNVHIWSFGVDPVFDIAPNASNDFYIKGGGGFYRKVTNFTNPNLQYYCDYYYGCGYISVNQVVAHYSSNQGGWNIGGGYYHRFGGIYGTGKMKFFAEARYLEILTPAVTATSSTTGGLVTQVPADTKLIPVTFGFSW
jgi:hypothetical protein